MKLGTRLFISFFMIIIIMVGISIFAIHKMYVLSNVTVDFYEHPFTVQKAITNSKYFMLKMHKDMKNMLLSDSEDEVNMYIEKVYQSEKEFLKELSIAKEGYLGDKKDIDDIMDSFNRWKIYRDEEIAFLKAGKINEARAITKGKAAKEIEALENHIENVSNFATSKAAAFMDVAVGTARNAIFITFIILFLAIAISLLITLFIVKNITVPIKRISEDVAKIGMGDLSINIISEQRDDEIGILSKEFYKTAEILRNQIKEISCSAEIIASAVSEIFVATKQMAASSSETATAINETTTTIEEVRQTSEVSSEKAKALSEIARRSSLISMEGKNATDDTIEEIKHIKEQMESIGETIIKLSEQSQSIGEIISSVQDLAEQSNILAVNASIEAVKAGEYGKGFTVVAQEVRSLAEQSKQATNQIKSILNDIHKATSAAVMATEQGAKAVDAGVKKSLKAGDAIVTLTDTVEDATQGAIQIEASSQQQMVGIEQVTYAAKNIKEAASQNLEGAKMLEGLARNLSELGEKLKDMVKNYKLDK